MRPSVGRGLYRLPALLSMVFALLMGCAAPSAGGGSARSGAAGSEPPRATRTLNSVMKVEPVSLAYKPVRVTGISVAHAVRLFNAELDILDGREVPRPYLAEAIPQLNTDSWKVFPDGRMETSYRLKPNLTWHDGSPLTAEDFVFGWRVYATPELGASSLRPASFMEDVQAMDARTVRITWRSLYPEANVLYDGAFPPLPRHLLQAAFEGDSAEAFTNSRFWDAEYVGAGPYRLERWEPGAMIEGVAFDGHVLGRPKIDRIVVRFMPDENTVLSNMLAGSIEFASDRTLRYEQAATLKNDWDPRGAGTVILSAVQPRFADAQLRPEYANPSAILDLRVRQALAHAIDRQMVNDGIFNGTGVISDMPITNRASYYAELDRQFPHRAHDVRRTEQLMAEAGYTKAADGFFASATGERLTPGYLQEIGAQTERETALVTASWRSAGFDFQISALAASQLRDTQARSTFPTIHTTAMAPMFRSGEKNLEQFTTAQIGSAANRWRGNNYGGWSNPDYDRLFQAYNSTLERTERNRHVVEMAKIVGDELPYFFIYLNYNVSAHSAALRGPDPESVDTLLNWNVHEWEMR
jgi:peptide/nickel transport system substrate-binding protein